MPHQKWGRILPEVRCNLAMSLNEEGFILAGSFALKLSKPTRMSPRLLIGQPAGSLVITVSEPARMRPFDQ